MVSVHGFVEAAQHAVGVGTNSNAVKMCSQDNIIDLCKHSGMVNTKFKNRNK